MVWGKVSVLKVEVRVEAGRENEMPGKVPTKGCGTEGEEGRATVQRKKFQAGGGCG